MSDPLDFPSIIERLEQAQVHPFYRSHREVLYQRDSLELMALLPEGSVDMIFADPPYMLSNDGFTCQNGRMVPVNKGNWDKSQGFEEDSRFHDTWIGLCRRLLKPQGSIWISGTYHSIYQCGYFLQKQGFHILNDISWFKPNAPPNLSCRVFTASHETLLWARKDKKDRHVFNYTAMKEGDFSEDKLKNPGTQMRSVWSIPASRAGEKEKGRHPTQKPLALLKRIILASTNAGALIVDPFCGSGSAGVAARELGDRYFLGVEINPAYCELSKKRLN